MKAEEGSAAAARYWIDKLNLIPHPEGGFYRETYRAPLVLSQSALPVGFHGDRNASTAIYFLLEGEQFSAFHRIASDEMWHFYTGGPLSVHVIDGTGLQFQIMLGANPEQGEVFQAVVPAGCWFAASLVQSSTFALVGCTVAPGFDFADFEMASRAKLINQYPLHKELIERLTRLP